MLSIEHVYCTEFDGHMDERVKKSWICTCSIWRPNLEMMQLLCSMDMEACHVPRTMSTRRKSKVSKISPALNLEALKPIIFEQEQLMANSQNKATFTEMLIKKLHSAGIQAEQSRGDADIDTVSVALRNMNCRIQRSPSYCVRWWHWHFVHDAVSMDWKYIRYCLLARRKEISFTWRWKVH